MEPVMRVVKSEYVVQRPVEPGYAPDSPDGWEDIGGGKSSTQSEAVRTVQLYPMRPVRIIKREVNESVITQEGSLLFGGDAKAQL